MSEPAIEHTAVEHTGRGPLSTDELAAVIGHDIPAGSYVNLGIGQPTKIADYLPTDENGNQAVILHTENGMLGMGPTATGDAIDPDLTNAGKVPVTELPGASYFHHADSFAMMRGGHLDVCVLGAYQVAANGDLANWHTGRPEDIPAVGGAMDLAIGAKDVYVMMTLFTKQGDAKLVQACTYPLTGLACVSRVYTDYATFDILTDGVHVLATYGISLADLRDRVQVKLLALARTTSASSPRDRLARYRGVSRKARAPAIQARCRSSWFGLPSESNPILLKPANCRLSRHMAAYRPTTSASSL